MNAKLCFFGSQNLFKYFSETSYTVSVTFAPHQCKPVIRKNLYA